jgi:hypothetical protein
MAAPHVFVTYSIQDAKGQTSVQKINFPVAADIAVLQDFVVTTATMINAIITGKIISAGIGLEVDLSTATIRATPLVNSDVEEGARFNWATALNTNTNFRMPTFDEAYLFDGTQEVDTTDAAVIAFTERVLNGRTVGLTNVSPSDDRGEDINTLVSARESFQSTRTP